jgi:predicted regulator of Ras-like GTPase activity (Roadblock/LC7/MglB family)
MVIRMNAVTTLFSLSDAALVSSETHSSAESDADRARALVAKLAAAGERSTSEMLHELRRAFPNAPLAVRVAALDAVCPR